MTTTAETTAPGHELRPLTFDQLSALMGDLRKACVAELKKGRTSLSYLETWDVKATLIKVFGFGGFSAEADKCEIVRIEDNVPKTDWVNGKKVVLPIEYAPDGKQVFGSANFRVTTRVRVKLTIHQLGAVYTEWAACSQTGPDLGDVTDFSIKTAESDALKRAAIYLGTQFGLSLYNDGSTEDVVRNVFEPNQRGMLWPGHVKLVNPASAPTTGEQEVAALQNIVHGQAGDQFAARPLPEGMTQEQRDANVALLNQAMSARAKVDAANGGPRPLESAGNGVDFAAMLAEDPGQAAVLEMDPRQTVTRSGDPVEMDPDYGGDGGKSEGMAYENM